MSQTGDRKGIDLSLEKQLDLERRTCPKCNYVVTNPFAERCPRCLTFVPVDDPGCAKCVHQSGCPVAQIKE